LRLCKCKDRKHILQQWKNIPMCGRAIIYVCVRARAWQANMQTGRWACIYKCVYVCASWQAQTSIANIHVCAYVCGGQTYIHSMLLVSTQQTTSTYIFPAQQTGLLSQIYPYGMIKCTYMHRQMHAHIYTHMYIYMHIYAQANARAYTRTYTYIHAHICTVKYTHICTCIYRRRNASKNNVISQNTQQKYIANSNIYMPAIICITSHTNLGSS
jgi:hypothetical protein